MASKFPTMMDSVTLVLRLIVKVIALIFLYYWPVRTGAVFLIILALLLSEFYELGALLVVTNRPHRRTGIYSVVALFNLLIALFAIYIIQPFSSEVFLLVSLLLASVALSGGVLPSLIISVGGITGLMLIWFLHGSSLDGWPWLELVFFIVVQILLGFLSRWYYQVSFINEELSGQRHRLDEASQLREKFTALVVRDLQAPLTSVKEYLELLQLKTFDAEKEVKEVVWRVVDQVERLTDRVEQLISLASLVPVIRPDALTKVKFKELIEQVMTKAKPLLDSQGGQVVLTNLPESDAKASLEVDVPAVVRGLVNLIEYLGRNLGEPSRVNVSGHADSKGVIVKLINPKLVIDDIELESLFSRFYRMEDTFSVRGDFGLGMYMAKSIFEAHQGKINSEVIPSGGVEFEVRLPFLINGKD